MQAQSLQGRVVKVTRRQPDLRGNKQRGKNLRLNLPEPKSINRVWVAYILCKSKLKTPISF